MQQQGHPCRLDTFLVLPVSHFTVFISSVLHFVRYLLEVIHYEGTGESYVHLKAKFFDTQFTNSWTGKAEQEEQTISISSTVVYDVQVRGRSHMSNWGVLCSS